MQSKQFYQSQPNQTPLEQDLQDVIGHNKQLNMLQLKTKVKNRISQIQNKSKFFQGQLDPLFLENKNIKQQLTELSRMLISSTQLLRNLLPQPRDPERKIALQMANIQGISTIIQQDWLRMKSQIAQLIKDLQTKKLAILTLEKQYSETIEKTTLQYNSLHAQYQQEVRRKDEQYNLLKQKLRLTVQGAEKQKKQTVQFYKQKMRQLQSLRRQYAQYIRQSKQKGNKYENTISKLKQQINSNIQQYERNRMQLKQIYEQKILDKEEEVKHLFENLMKSREEETKLEIKEANEYIIELQEKIKSKKEQVEYLHELNMKFMDEKKELGEDLDLAKESILKHKGNIEQLKQKIAHDAEEMKQLNDVIIEYKLNTLKLEQQIQHKNDKIKQLQHNTEQLQISHRHDQEASREHINKLNDQIADKVQQLQRAKEMHESKLRRAEQEHGAKHKHMQDTIDEYIHKLDSKEKEMQLMAKEHSEQAEQMKKEHEEKEKALKDKYKEKMREKESALLHKINQIERQYRNTISEMELSMQDRTASLVDEHKKRMREKEQYYLQQEQMLNKHLQQCRHLLEQRQAQLSNLAKELEAQVQTNRKQQQQHRSKLIKLQEQHDRQVEQSIKKYKTQLEQIKMILESKEQEFKNKLQFTEQEFNSKLMMREKEYNSKLQLLEENIHTLKTNSGVAEIQAKYAQMIRRLNEEFQTHNQGMEQDRLNQIKALAQQHNRVIKEMEEKHSVLIKGLSNKHSMQLAQNERKYSEQLSNISTKLQTNITYLNQQLLNEQEAHKFTKLSREQKIQYLIAKIDDIKNIIHEKDIKIQQLAYDLHKAKKELEKVDEIVEEKLNKKKQQYQAYIQTIKAQCQNIVMKVNSQCNLKIKNIQLERIKFTESLYKDFQEIKQKYEKQLYSLNKKYNQLQKLFEERPSRIEDVKKIKQLISVRQKMNEQVRQFKKQINSANQIVRYLNLQFQNYKEVYNIFGPEGPETKMAEKKNEEIQNYLKDNLRYGVQPSTQRSRRSARQQLTIRDILRAKNRRSSTEIEQQPRTENKAISQVRHQLSMREMEAEQEEQPTQKQKLRGNYQNTSQDQQRQVKEVYKIHKIRRPDLNKITRQKQQWKISKEQSHHQQGTIHQLRNNAQLFINLIQNSQRPPAELNRGHQGYGKMIRKRRTQSKMQGNILIHKEKEGRFQSKYRNLSIQY